MRRFMDGTGKIAKVETDLWNPKFNTLTETTYEVLNIGTCRKFEEYPYTVYVVSDLEEVEQKYNAWLLDTFVGMKDGFFKRKR